MILNQYHKAMLSLLGLLFVPKGLKGLKGLKGPVRDLIIYYLLRKWFRAIWLLFAFSGHCRVFKWPTKSIFKWKYWFLAFFSSWMAQYGPQQQYMNRAFRCNSLDTPHAYIPKIFLGTKIGAKQLKGLGRNDPFGPRGYLKGPRAGKYDL